MIVDSPWTVKVIIVNMFGFCKCHALIYDPYYSASNIIHFVHAVALSEYLNSRFKVFISIENTFKSCAHIIRILITKYSSLKI